ncbi:Meiotic Sister-Chromatid recombination aldehyde dehydrogenase [Paecilomyces lecythidis]|uniref:Meiotic Sister-Chromatid recombination aldehyde dehydrogenase n=1 Tax=Paecilomyces lecythidis TaxID=3004212 RepID=A0ABR3YFE1_9EURO
MELTPIRVRGRRKRRAATKTKSLDEKENGESKAVALRRPKGGRPMMSFADKAASQSQAVARSHMPKKTSSAKRRRKLSRLECLPVELIEKIFLYSLDVDLPRSSPALAAALSRERMYRVFILLSFWNDVPVENDAAQPAIARILAPAEYERLDEERRKALQSDVLRCRWCTVQRILGQLPELMNLAIQKYWLGVGITMDVTNQQAFDNFLAKDGDTRIFEGTDSNGNHYTLSVIPLLSITVTCAETQEVNTHRILSVKGFPDGLLRGDDGFSDDDIAYLETLRTGHGFDAPGTDVSFSRDALQQGIHNALVEHNSRALCTLLKIDEYFTRHRLESEGTDPSASSYSIPPEHFHTAVTIAGDDPTIFQLLLRANAESLPADDSAITQWAMDLHSAFGSWLLDFMVQLPEHIDAARANPRTAGLFYMGRANHDIEPGRRYLDEVLGVTELSSWMDETEFDVTSLWETESPDSPS